LDELLGRFVVDIFSPLDFSAPKVVSDITSAHALEPISSEDLAVTLNSIHNESAVGRLRRILELAAKKGWNQKLKIESSKVETRRLKDHDDVFEGLTGDAAKVQEIAKLFKYSKSGILFWRKHVFMIVGVKILSDPTVSFERTDKSSAEVKAEASLDKIANSLVPGSGEAVPKMEGEVKREDELGQVLESKTRNQQQIFAVEYRGVTRALFAKKEYRRGIKLGPKKRFDWGNGVMGADEDEDGLPEELRTDQLESPNTVSDASSESAAFWFKAE
jgi:hypothetical protein